MIETYGGWGMLNGRTIYGIGKIRQFQEGRLMALNLGTSPEMGHRHFGHDNTRSRASEFADVWLTKEEE